MGDNAKRSFRWLAFVLVPGAVLTSLVILLLPVFFGRNGPDEFAGSTLSPEEMKQLLSERHERYWKEWLDEHHPSPLSPEAVQTVSREMYAKRLENARARYALSIALPADATREGFQKWQSTARAKLMALLFGDRRPDVGEVEVNAVPPDKPLDVFVHTSFRRYGLRAIVFHSRPRRRVRALVAVPSGLAEGERRPAIVALPGHFGTPEGLFALDELSTAGGTDPGAYMYAYGHVLANAGYVVVAPDTGYCPFLCKNVKEDELPDGWAWDGMRVADALASVTVTAQLPEVDPERIGCFGHSLGGEVAMFLGALDERVKATVISGYLSTYHPDQGCKCRLVPDLESFLRYADVCALVAPRSLLDIEGIADRGEPARHEALGVRYAFSVAGVPNRFVQIVHDGAHTFYAGPEVLEFLDEALENGDNRDDGSDLTVQSEKSKAGI